MKTTWEVAYLCRSCAAYTVALLQSEHIAPATVPCRSMGCSGYADLAEQYLSEHRPVYVPAPVWIWYRPNWLGRMGLSVAERELMRSQGGLLLRKLSGVDLCENCGNAKVSTMTDDDVGLCWFCYAVLLDDMAEHDHECPCSTVEAAETACSCELQTRIAAAKREVDDRIRGGVLAP